MYTAKINELKAKIEKVLLPILKGKKCIYIDLPYHLNIGDILIWQGTEYFLNDNKITCFMREDKDSFKFPVLDKDVVILFHGGGNFGDIWPAHHLFRNKVIAHYLDNKIIILPQTVFFSDKENMITDADQLSIHRNLTIIGRDQVSYDILNKYYYRNDILMLPDMAFYINLQSLHKQCVKETKTIMFFRRQDKEAADIYDFLQIVPSDAEQHEWPTMEPHMPAWQERCLSRVRKYLPPVYKWYWNYVMRPYYVSMGVRFISSYKQIYTTRLHGAILSILLGKPVTIFDNSYGKNSSFYDTWLSDVEDVKFIR